MTLLAELNARYTDTAFRLEVLQDYGGEDTPGPLRSVSNDPYLERVARHTLSGKRRDRVHVVSWPLSPYMIRELDSYRANVAVGEAVLIAPAGERTTNLGPDFWLFDEDTDHAEAAVMHYEAGGLTSIEHITDRERLADLQHQATTARAAAVDLSDYLQTLAELGHRRVG